MKAIDLHLMPLAYGAAIAFWGYPILIILLIGTWRGHRRTLKELRAAASSVCERRWTQPHCG